jgi:hypothetical protein
VGDTSTPTEGPAATATSTEPTSTPTQTLTPGPSPTPEDIIHNAPFYDDVTTENWWRLDTDEVFTGFNEWTIDWWTTSSSQRNTSAVDSRMSNTPTCTSTYGEADILFYWGGSGPAPGGDCSGTPWRSDDFATRWTRVVSFENDITLKLTTISDDGIRVIIDGTTVNSVTDWSAHGENTLTGTYTFTGGVEHTIVVEYFEFSGDAIMAFFMRAETDDVGTCTWTMSDESTHTGPTAWSDSPSRNYSDNSTCHLALRGAVNLATLSDPPRMTFWNRWDMNNYDKAWLQVREYGDTGPWYGKLIHENYQEQLSWQRETVDLANYEGVNASTSANVTMDWTGKTIEFRFVLEADNSNNENGWWIDDIVIENNIIKTYTIGFADNMESGDENWLPGGSWAISNEQVRSGNGAWSDSPGAYYNNNVNATLELDGMVDLTVPESTAPELVFYSQWDLASGDNIYVEASPDRTTWTSLTPARTNSALQGDSSNYAFIRETVSLAAYDGQTFYLRFRIASNNSSQKQGWWIDDILIQNGVTGNMPYPFFDNMEGGGANWLPDGSWSLSPEQTYSGSSAWSDNPGANYINLSNASLQTSRPFLLTTSTATRPQLSFWYRRDIAYSDKLYLETSTDGSSWTSIWNYSYSGSSSKPSYAPEVSLSEFNKQLAWERVTIDMTSYISDTTPFYIRFRMDALTGSNTGDGVWIDDVRLAEYVETPHAFPFQDDMEATTNWYAGGNWTLSTESAHSGAYAWSDSPGTNYATDTWSFLELKQPIDLTSVASASFPVLTWWDRFALNSTDFVRVQVSTWQGSTASEWSNWSEWQQIYSADRYASTSSWGRHQVDLRAYSGEKIRLRFVLDALVNSNVSGGWWIDDVGVSTYNPQRLRMDFYDDANSLNNWIPEGTWGLDSVYYGAGSGPATLGPGLWTAYFYDLREYGCDPTPSWGAEQAITGNSLWCSGVERTYSVIAQAQLASIDYDCGSDSSPNPDGTCNTTPWKSNHDDFAIHFVRNITTEEGTYEFTLRSDDGSRVYVDGTQVVDYWYDHSASTQSGSIYLSAGTHVLEVWYYENGGGAVIQLDVARPNYSLHDSPGDVDYDDGSNMSLTLDGVLDMSGTNNPLLSWYDTYELAYNDCARVEISLPYETGQFDVWHTVYSRCNSTNTSWNQHTVNLRSEIASILGVASGSLDLEDVLLTMRFRLDARSNSNVGDGWWIEDIILAD